MSAEFQAFVADVMPVYDCRACTVRFEANQPLDGDRDCLSDYWIDVANLDILVAELLKRQGCPCAKVRDLMEYHTFRPEDLPSHWLEQAFTWALGYKPFHHIYLQKADIYSCQFYPEDRNLHVFVPIEWARHVLDLVEEGVIKMEPRPFGKFFLMKKIRWFENS